MNSPSLRLRCATRTRSRLRLVALSVVAAVAFAPVIRAADPVSPGPHAVTAESWARLPPHPRLFATAAQWQELRTRLASDPVATRLFAVVRTQAEALLKQPPVTIRQRSRGILSGSMLEPAREVQRRVLLLAATARLTGETRFRDRALVELQRLTALADWNPAVFLDTAEATLAVAVGYARPWVLQSSSSNRRRRSNRNHDSAKTWSKS